MALQADLQSLQKGIEFSTFLQSVVLLLGRQFLLVLFIPFVQLLQTLLLLHFSYRNNPSAIGQKRSKPSLEPGSYRFEAVLHLLGAADVLLLEIVEALVSHGEGLRRRQAFGVAEAGHVRRQEVHLGLHLPGLFLQQALFLWSNLREQVQGSRLEPRLRREAGSALPSGDVVTVIYPFSESSFGFLVALLVEQRDLKSRHGRLHHSHA